jgi:hypothetical protein
LPPLTYSQLDCTPRAYLRHLTYTDYLPLMGHSHYQHLPLQGPRQLPAICDCKTRANPWSWTTKRVEAWMLCVTRTRQTSATALPLVLSMRLPLSALPLQDRCKPYPRRIRQEARRDVLGDRRRVLISATAGAKSSRFEGSRLIPLVADDKTEQK